MKIDIHTHIMPEHMPNWTQKFGYGEVREIDGNKMTVQFDKAGEKRVVNSFVQAA